MRVTLEGDGHPPVSGVLDSARGARRLLVLGHGAGAPMTHPFMEKLAGALVAEGISTLRYNFAYAQAGRRRPDAAGRRQAVAASALKLGRRLAGGAALFAGGKSMGGRTTSSLIARRGGPEADGASPASGLAGLVFFGFPLHPHGRPDTARAEHLARIELPMLFHQGTRDRLADVGLMRAVVARLGPRAVLHEVEDAGHSFDVPKRSGRTVDETIARLARQTADWAQASPAGDAGRAAAAPWAAWPRPADQPGLAGDAGAPDRDAGDSSGAAGRTE